MLLGWKGWGVGREGSVFCPGDVVGAGGGSVVVFCCCFFLDKGSGCNLPKHVYL